MGVQAYHNKRSYIFNTIFYGTVPRDLSIAGNKPPGTFGYHFLHGPYAIPDSAKRIYMADFFVYVFT